MNERRHARRRNVPYLRSGVLETGERSHLVVIVDLSAEGAYLSTRIEAPATAALRLRTVMPNSGRSVALPCEVVWSCERFDVASGRPAGMAVRFLDVDDETRRELDDYASEGLGLTANHDVAVRYEYRVIEAEEVNVEALNQLGRDGWALNAVVPGQPNHRLIMSRIL
jgi:hypothetical protein